MGVVGRCVASGLLAGTALAISQRPATDALIDVYFDEEGVPLINSSISNQRRRMHGSRGCLNFLHIPKTGGTSVEAAGNSPWGFNDRSLTCKDLGVGCLNGKNTPVDQRWRCCHLPDGSQCSVWHVPPHVDDLLEQSYAGCETFCVVREPVARFRSQHSYKNGECSTGALKWAVDKKMRQVQNKPYADDCHLIPQVDFWRNGKDCQHVIRQENLQQDLTKLMKKFGMRARFPSEHKLGTNCEAPFDQESLDKLHQFYKADYEAFGYSMQ